MSDPLPFTVTESEIRLSVRLTPGASANAIGGLEADASGRPWLRVRVAARPVEGKANDALIGFLAKRWGLSKSSVAIVGGATARNKTLALRGDLSAIRSAVEADL
jgi:uncharacterized protein